jgi:hypothetical protein
VKGLATTALFAAAVALAVVLVSIALPREPEPSGVCVAVADLGPSADDLGVSRWIVERVSTPVRDGDVMTCPSGEFVSVIPEVAP